MKKDSLALLLIILLAFIAYSNAFHGEFQYDDDRLIRFNFALRDPSAWQSIARFEPFRPLTLFTYAWNYKIGKKDPFSYHVFDFVFHVLAVSLFYIFIRRISKNLLICFFSAALFAVHPLNTESVSYTASRPILLCAIFYWSALLCFESHLRKSEWWKVVGFFLFLVLGLLSKEEATLIPVAALLFNYAFYGAQSVKKHWLFHAFTFVLIACGVAYRLSFLDAKTPHPFSIYIATEIYVWLRYLALAIFPIPLNVDHFVEPLSLTHWKFLLSLLGVSVLGVMLWLSRMGFLQKPAKNSKGKMNFSSFAIFCKNEADSQTCPYGAWIFFWGFWFFLNLTATSVIPLNDFMAEHRTYLSMFGFCACVATLVSLAKTERRLIPIALSCLLVFYIAATWKRNQVWEKPVTLWADSVEKSPMKYRPHMNLAFSLYEIRQYAAAMKEYMVARQLSPYSPFVHSGLGFTLLEMKNPDAAEKSFLNALRVDPKFIDAKTGVGIVKYYKKDYAQAIVYFEQVHPHRRESPELVRMMCESYLHLDRTSDALRILSAASEWDSRFLHILKSLESGKTEEASRELAKIRLPIPD